MVFFTIDNIKKQYGDIKVLDGINLDIRQGEFISLLGESGSGKTTLLRIISGLEEKHQGEMFLDGKNITGLPAQKRGVSMVFQDYLLFPHLNAIENIEFGLKIRGVEKKQRYQEARKLLQLVQMEEHQCKYPWQLSGGQKQRIAIARAVIVKPLLLLLDEPFSSLDSNLRIDMCDFIRSIQKQTGITTMLVTHDREEAMKISSRIALLHNGSVAQFDEPSKLYEYPRSLYTATFMGDMNILSRENGHYNVVRPEDIAICREDGAGCKRGYVTDMQYTGSRTKCKVGCEGKEISLFLAGNAENVKIGDSVFIEIDRSKVRRIKA